MNSMTPRGAQTPEGTERIEAAAAALAAAQEAVANLVNDEQGTILDALAGLAARSTDADVAADALEVRKAIEDALGEWSKASNEMLAALTGAPKFEAK